jgi:hypothetical protein
MDDNPLKLRHRAERAHYPHHVLLRVDRTLSWFYRGKSFETTVTVNLSFCGSFLMLPTGR